MTLESLIPQIWITVFGLLAIYLVADKRAKIRRYGFICGAIGQPAWFYLFISTQQWFMLILTTVYLISWIRGVITSSRKES
jgi:membrane associated rhomboid family serine protease